jgi:hypothetical protein
MKQAWTLLLSGAAIILHAQPSNRQQAWFPDGTGLEVYTEATGSTKPSAAGVSGIGPGIGKQDLVFRLVVDSVNHILFGYNLEASHGARPGAVVIRIEPLSAAMEASLRAEPADSPWPKFSGAHIPTVATVREFSAVKIGEVVTLDILYNRSTGEKLYDVLRPIAGPSPGVMEVSPSRSREEISLKEVAVKVNKKVVLAPTSWLIGAAVRIDIPGRGAYVVAVYDPQNVPPILHLPAAWACRWRNPEMGHRRGHHTD